MKEDLNAWMDEIKTPQALPGGKGKVVAIHTPEVTETKFGNRGVMQVVIEGSDGSTINVKVFLPAQFPLVHPKSNLAKIMAQYGCKQLRDLLGKEVEVVEVGNMLWKIKAD